MGKTYSAPLPKPTSKCPYFVIVLRPPKAIVLIFADENVKSIISSRLITSWSYGLKNGDAQGGQKMSDGSYEFILRSTPFTNKGDPKLILELNLLFCNLLIDLKNIGWRLVYSSKDLSQPTPGSACSSLYFRKMDNDFVAVANENSPIIGVHSINVGEQSNILRFVNTNAKLVSNFVSIIEPVGTCKLISDGTLKIDESMGGYCDTLYSRRFLIKAIYHLRTFGYRFYASINFDGVSDVLFFEHIPLPPNPTSISIANHDPEAIMEEDEDVEENLPIDKIDKLEGEEELDDHTKEFVKSYTSTTSSSTSATSSASSSSSSVPYFILDIFKSNNRLRLIKAPLRIVFVIRSLISVKWPFGLRSMTRLDLDAYEFVIGIDSGKDEKNVIRGNSTILFCQLFQTLMNHDWQMEASLDLSRHSDKWTFIFYDGGWMASDHSSFSEQKTKSGMNGHTRPSPQQLSDFRPRSISTGTTGHRIWCICMSGPSTINIINGRQIIKEIICELINRYWPRGVKNVVEFGGNRRIRLVGQPWIPSVYSKSIDQTNPNDHRENEDLLSRSLLCIILSELIENYECRPLCTASVCWKTSANDRNQLSDAHCSWFFIDPHSDDQEDDKMENGVQESDMDLAFKRRSTM